MAVVNIGRSWDSARMSNAPVECVLRRLRNGRVSCARLVGPIATLIRLKLSSGPSMFSANPEILRSSRTMGDSKTIVKHNYDTPFGEHG